MCRGCPHVLVLQFNHMPPSPPVSPSCLVMPSPPDTFPSDRRHLNARSWSELGRKRLDVLPTLDTNESLNKPRTVEERADDMHKISACCRDSDPLGIPGIANVHLAHADPQNRSPVEDDQPFAMTLCLRGTERYRLRLLRPNSTHSPVLRCRATVSSLLPKLRRGWPEAALLLSFVAIALSSTCPVHTDSPPVSIVDPALMLIVDVSAGTLDANDKAEDRTKNKPMGRKKHLMRWIYGLLETATSSRRPMDIVRLPTFRNIPRPLSSPCNGPELSHALFHAHSPQT
ncbi:hypothetical protein R3P38DRAFT_1646386 [Favolaschia claudopus]|uniref:Uncharacterized protein n=1 Tax=Favolaschia claudopus TaxID=2862362 RepID=A0AAW0DL29_9AGAR